MKLSVYAREVGVSYRTAFRWFKSGKIQGRQMGTGTIPITEPIGAHQTPEPPVKVAIYTRVSAAENRDDLVVCQSFAGLLCRQRLSRGMGSKGNWFRGK